ncbi:MAG TPA: peptidylprolyl isomerase [Dehalococcoidia bacterium]|nr:peptidylprolyl isomerase [Dehalococcoidia bacterium]
MSQAKNGDTVKVHYTGKLNDGTVFDTSTDREPLEFTIGNGQLIQDFEQAVIGMNPGESKTVQISSKNAYGPHRDDMLIVVDRSQFPENLEPRIDQQLQIRNQNGESSVATVVDISGTSVTLDANHPLAGQDLTFEIQLTEIA